MLGVLRRGLPNYILGSRIPREIQTEDAAYYESTGDINLGFELRHQTKGRGDG